MFGDQATGFFQVTCALKVLFALLPSLSSCPFSTCRSRFWLFLSYVVSFASVVGAVWVLMQHYGEARWPWGPEGCRWQAGFGSQHVCNVAWAGRSLEGPAEAGTHKGTDSRIQCGLTAAVLHVWSHPVLQSHLRLLLTSLLCYLCEHCLS